MGEAAPYISDTSDGTGVVKRNINGDFSDYLFINFTSGYREELLQVKNSIKNFYFIINVRRWETYVFNVQLLLPRSY